MIILALTSDAFQALALGWISALTAVAIASGYALAKVWPIIADLKARYDALHTRTDDITTRQNSQGARITEVALAVTPAPKPGDAPSPNV